MRAPYECVERLFDTHIDVLIVGGGPAGLSSALILGIAREDDPGRQHAAAGAVADHIPILGEIQPSHK